MGIYRAITKDSYEAIEEMYAGKGYGAFKSDIADLLVATLEPIQQRYNELITSPELDVILDEGAAKAHAKASMMYRKVEQAMGLEVNYDKTRGKRTIFGWPCKAYGHHT